MIQECTWNGISSFGFSIEKVWKEKNYLMVERISNSCETMNLIEIYSTSCNRIMENGKSEDLIPKIIF